MIKKISIPEALECFKTGQMLIVIDDENRENEGDLVLSAKFATPENINFMAALGRGMICAPLSPEKATQLNLPLMIAANEATHQTAFTVTVDAAFNISTGISASERAHTLNLLYSSENPADFVRPGHIFPLIAKKGGVLARPGHTEATVDLANLSGLAPVGVICEIMNEDGTMARLPELLVFAEKFNIPLMTIRDLIEYRQATEHLLNLDIEVNLPTEFGDFKLQHFTNLASKESHLALVKGDLKNNPNPLVRIHSSCVTGDIFCSSRCDCGQQLKNAMKQINAEGSGMVIYLNQEGRGIGLLNKLKAYKLQESGQDTVEANLSLGLLADLREYSFAYQILKFHNVKNLRLLTNNPQKINALKSFQLKVQHVPSQVSAQANNWHYLQTKALKMGHLFGEINEQ